MPKGAEALLTLVPTRREVCALQSGSTLADLWTRPGSLFKAQVRGVGGHGTRRVAAANPQLRDGHRRAAQHFRVADVAIPPQSRVRRPCVIDIAERGTRVQVGRCSTVAGLRGPVFGAEHAHGANGGTEAVGDQTDRLSFLDVPNDGGTAFSGDKSRSGAFSACSFEAGEASNVAVDYDSAFGCCGFVEPAGEESEHSFWSS